LTRRLKTEPVTSFLREAISTKTKIYVNLAQPELAEIVAAKNVDGVGLLRAEFIVAQIGEHPRYMIEQNRGHEFVDKLYQGINKQNRGHEFVDKLYQGINTFAKAFDPRPVVYRTTDFKTNEYRDLKGGQDYEDVEENPMIGYRGASRYVAESDIFDLEVEAIKRVREDHKNLWVMIPFVRTVDGMAKIKKANVFLIDKFLDVGLDGISIGTNDLTQLILGIDRDNSRLDYLFDERNEAVLVALERVIKVAKSKGVTSSICGQAPSVYPELTEKLVEWGITSVSVTPDMIGATREIVAKAEARLNIK